MGIMRILYHRLCTSVNRGRNILNVIQSAKWQTREISPDWVEGPSPLFVGETLYVYIDFYGKGGYGAVKSDDRGKTWKRVPPEEMSFPKGIRHGTAFAVDRAVVDALRK